MSDEIEIKQNSNITSICFSVHFLNFIKVCVKSCILTCYITLKENNTKYEILNVLRNGSFFVRNLVEYLNLNWKRYNNQSDREILEKINIMLLYGGINHAYCLFKLIWTYSHTVLLYTMARLDINDLINENILSDNIDLVSDKILSLKVDGMDKYINLCDEKCNNFVKYVNDNYL